MCQKSQVVRPEGAEAPSPGPLGSAACLSKNALGAMHPKAKRPVRAKAFIINAFALTERFIYNVRLLRCGNSGYGSEE